MSGYTLKYKPYGNSAILIQWPHEMNDKILKDIILVHQKIYQEKIKAVIEIIQSINSLTVVYETNLISFHYLKKYLESLYIADFKEAPKQYFQWKIPVCYDSFFGLDLQEIAVKNKLTVDEIIQLHTEAIYLVYSIGFLPGFLYLGGLDKRLHIDRKSEPRLKIPKGAVAIGGKQTGIYPRASPGGWQIIGNSPIAFFDKKNASPCFAKPGDKIQFIQISYYEYEQLQKLIALDKYTIEKEVIDD